MNPFSAEDEIARWLAYCERSAPGFMDAIQSASGDEIRSIEAASGQVLPAEYAAFLAVMGNTDAESVHPLFNEFTFGIADSLLFYREPPVPLLADAIYVGTGGGDCEFYLDTSVQGSGPGPVITCSWYVDTAGKYTDLPPSRFKVADSWLAYLYRKAFAQFRTPSLEFHLSLREAPANATRDDAHAMQRAERFNRVAEQLGLAQLLHSDPAIRLYEKSDAAVSFISAVLASDGVEIHAETEREAARLAEIISDHTGMRRVR